MKKIGNVVVVESDFDETLLRDDINEHSKSWSDFVQEYCQITGNEVLDHRSDIEHEYTEVSAQRDPDFYDEGLSYSELEEIQQAKSIYHV